MTMTALDNPVWHSLATRHATLARSAGGVARYPADVAPFAGAEAFGAGAGARMLELVDPGETVLFVGPAPDFDTRWKVETLEHIAQMTCAEPLPVASGPPVVALDSTHVADVLELTSRVYPHYFRPRTPEMGRYFGIYDGSKLAAITGERMGFDGHTELSAICTDPAYLGRGYARRLVALLVNDVLARGELAFLHVSHRNSRAKTLYEHMGFRWRADIALVAARRVA